MNSVNLRPVDLHNFDQIIAMEPLPHQMHYVAPNVESVAQAYVQAGCWPYAIYAGEAPVGFIMYCLDADDDQYWIYRLMIDKNHQGHSYGRRAMELALAEIRTRQPHGQVYLGVEPENTEATALYERLGFTRDGRQLGGETIFVLTY